MPKSAKSCVFCGATSDLTNEHVIPEWLQKRLGIQGLTFFSSLNTLVESSSTVALGLNRPLFHSQVDREHLFASLLNGNVCGACNHGWMSDLERGVQSFLLELIHNERDIQTLSKNETLLLTLWTAKTAYAWYFAAREPPLVPDDHPRRLQSKLEKIEPNAIVIASQIQPDVNYNHYFSSDWQCRNAGANVDAVEGIQKRAYKLSFQLLHLHLMIAHWPEREWSFIIVPGIHHVIHNSHARFFWLPAWEPMPSPIQFKTPLAHEVFHSAVSVSKDAPD
jgi:hypothetical protein